MTVCKKAIVSVDYITATAKYPSQREAFEVIASSQLTENAIAGYKASPFRFYGYDGWKSGELAYGERNDGTLVKVWGDLADDLWREIAVYAHNVTRLDLCVDCILESPRLDLAKEANSAVEAHWKQRAYSLITSHDGGQTFYLGSRVSDKFGRVYDKGVQSKTFKPGVHWRYELEAKGQYAYDVSRKLLEMFFDDQIGVMGGLVFRYFDKAGIPMLFPEASDTFVSSTKKQPLAGDELLEWLRVQVRPTVQRLVAIGGAERVMDALGLL